MKMNFTPSAQRWLLTGTLWILWLVLACAILLAATHKARAQFGVEQPMFASASAAASIDTLALYRWWVFKDALLGVTLSNQILDRVVGDHLWQMNTAISPTNGPYGAYFSGTTYLTNTAAPSGYDPTQIPVPGINKATFFYVFRHNGVATEQQMFSFGSPNNRGPGMNGTNVRYTGIGSGGPWTVCSVAANTMCDIVLTINSDVVTFYTNGIPARTNVVGSGVDSFAFLRMGSGNLGNYSGFIAEAGFYTNKIMSQLEITSLHTYFTNTYSYAP